MATGSRRGRHDLNDRPLSITHCKICDSHKQEDSSMQMLKMLWESEEGQDLTEYALLLVLISLIAVASLKVAGQAVSDAFSNAAANLTTNT